jgi:putative endonuclease
MSGKVTPTPSIRHGRACPGHPRLAEYPHGSGFVYILTNPPNGILYVGVTSDLVRRVFEHRSGFVDGFTKRYGLKRLVYFEKFDDIRDAIQREHNIKHWSRAWKVRTIIAANPDWDDLYPTITQ